MPKIPHTTPIPPETWHGPGHLTLLHNTFGITLVFQSDTTTPEDALPPIHAHFTTQDPATIQWHKFPGANFWRSQTLDDQTLNSFEFRNPDSTWQEFFIER